MSLPVSFLVRACVSRFENCRSKRQIWIRLHAPVPPVRSRPSRSVALVCARKESDGEKAFLVTSRGRPLPPPAHFHFHRGGFVCAQFVAPAFSSLFSLFVFLFAWLSVCWCWRCFCWWRAALDSPLVEFCSRRCVDRVAVRRCRRADRLRFGEAAGKKIK